MNPHWRPPNHDDAKREYAYGPANGLPDTKFGTFSESLIKVGDKNEHLPTNHGFDEFYGIISFLDKPLTGVVYSLGWGVA